MTNPYPESVFPSLTKEEIQVVVKAIQATGFTSDRVHGAWGRIVWDNAQKATFLEVGEWLNELLSQPFIQQRLLRGVEKLLSGKMPEEVKGEESN